MGWSTFLKTTGKYVLKGGRATVESAGSAVIHPQRTIKGLGTAAKTAAVGGGMAYVGWEKLTTDKSVTRIVGDAVVGEGTMESVSNKVDTAIEGVNDLKEKVGETVSTMNEAMTDMIGNFFSNLGKGNVSGLSLAGLVVSALLVFGRFGWLGKIAGAVLGMMMIGNNANMSQLLGGQRQTPQIAQTEPQQQTTGGGMRR